MIELFETTENLRNVRAVYMKAFEKLKSKENIFITEGNRSPEEIATDIWNEVARISV